MTHHEVATAYIAALETYQDWKRLWLWHAQTDALDRLPDIEGLICVKPDGTEEPWPNPRRSAVRLVSQVHAEYEAAKQRLIELSKQLEATAEHADKKTLIALRLVMPRETAQEFEQARIVAEAIGTRAEPPEVNLRDYVPKKLCLDPDIAPHYSAVNRLLKKHPEIKTLEVDGKERVHHAEWLRMITAEKAKREKAVDENPKLVKAVLAEKEKTEAAIANEKKERGDERVNQAAALTRLLTSQKK